MAALSAPPDDVSLVARVRRSLADLGCSAAEVTALVVLVAGAVAVLGMLWVVARPGEPPAGAASGGPWSADAEGLGLLDEELVVHVAGQVAAPGLYRLPGGARVADALDEAGGPLPDAVLDGLNLARPLSDGEQLLVPGPAPPPGEHPDGGGQPQAAASAWRPDGLLDLNRATPADLEELPGIGPVLAARIVAYREDVGGFTAVGDLRDVGGIGEQKFQAIADLVAV